MVKTSLGIVTMDTAYTACSTSENNISRQKCCSLKRIMFQYGGYILICLLTFGIYFCYDNPGALQDKFQTDLDMPTSKFVMLYAIYSWPNVILCVFGGFLVDSLFGIRWGTIIYLTMTLCGQLLFAMGTFVDVFWLMVLGRFFFGIGAESVNIAQNSYTFIWFEGKSLNTLFGLQSTFALLGAISNSLTIEKIYRFVSETLNYSGHECIGIVLFVAAITLLGSIVCAILLACMHKDDVSKQDESKPPAESVKLSDIKDFPLTFWLIVFLCSAYYVAIFPFTSLAKLYFMRKYEFESDEANTTISLTYTVSAIIAPLFGILIDKTGRNIFWVVVSINGSLFAHTLITFTYTSPYVCMILLGLSSSIFTTSMWPMIAHVMPEHQLGTAYGINQAFLNFSSAVTAIICGIIVDKYGYFILQLFYMSWLLMAIVPALIIWMSDPKSTDKRYRTVEKPNVNTDVLEDGLLQSSAREVDEKSSNS